MQAAALRLQAKRYLTVDALIEAVSVLLAELVNAKLGCAQFCAELGGSLAGAAQGVLLACFVQALVSSAIDVKDAAGGWQPRLFSQGLAVDCTSWSILFRHVCAVPSRAVLCE